MVSKGLDTVSELFGFESSDTVYGCARPAKGLYISTMRGRRLHISSRTAHQRIYFVRPILPHQDTSSSARLAVALRRLALDSEVPSLTWLIDRFKEGEVAFAFSEACLTASAAEDIVYRP